MKLCKDCRFYVSPRLFRFEKCTHKSNLHTDFVTGATSPKHGPFTLRYGYTLDSGRKVGNICGADGKLFEPK